MRLLQFLVVLPVTVVSFYAPVSKAWAESIGVTTLNWPPYTGTKLPKLGATTYIVQAAFERVGIKARVDFLPWKRAISRAKNSDNSVAYFPGYHCRLTDGFVASDPIGKGPLGLAQHVKGPIKWKSIDDLGEQKLKIGTVLGYANTDEFDEKAGTGWVRAIPAKNDLTNLRKLLRRRIDAAVIDKLVLSYLVATEPALKSGAKMLQFNGRPLADKTLFLCFRNNERGGRSRNALIKV